MDENLEVAVVGGPLKLYDVVMHGVPTRMKLNEADAERYNATLVKTEGSESPAPEEGQEPDSKARSVPNKARQARGKAASGDG